jgi:hypothetical protein
MASALRPTGNILEMIDAIDFGWNLASALDKRQVPARLANLGQLN